VNNPRNRKRPEEAERTPFRDKRRPDRGVARSADTSEETTVVTRTRNYVRHLKPHKNPKVDIRKDYKTTLMFGLALSLSLVIWLFRADIRTNSNELSLNLTQQEVVQMEEIQQTEQVERPPAPPRPPVPVEVPNDTVLENEVLDLDATLDLDDALADLPPPPPPPPTEEAETVPEPEIFVAVEQMPQIIGGDSKVYDYLVYPELARQAGMQGLVIVQIVVDENGIPSDPQIIRSAGLVLDNAAQDAVMKLRFIPGRQRGRAVKVRMSVPIRFELRMAR
jgi:protein TonB